MDITQYGNMNNFYRLASFAVFVCFHQLTFVYIILVNNNFSNQILYKI